MWGMFEKTGISRFALYHRAHARTENEDDGVDTATHSRLVAMEVTKKAVTPSVGELFKSMEYGPAPESDKTGQQWLDDHGRNFGHFINNQWVKPDNR